MTTAVETVARFGPFGAITGILTEPTNARSDRPTVVLINTGVTYRVGNQRMYVGLARTLAEAGCAVLRFDLSGLGDSAAREPAADPAIAADADIRDALDWLEARGLGTFVLMGLCSGADRSLVYAARDLRVRGLILLDPTVPPTARFLFLLLRHRTVKAVRHNLLATLKGAWPRASPAAPNGQLGAGPLAAIDRRRVKGFLEKAWTQVLANGTEALAIFTSGVQRSHNYREQLLDAFPRVEFGSRLSLHYLKGISHSLFTEEERAQCFALVIDWLMALGAKDEGRHVPDA